MRMSKSRLTIVKTVAADQPSGFESLTYSANNTEPHLAQKLHIHLFDPVAPGISSNRPENAPLAVYLAALGSHAGSAP